ncbi:MAG TPA: hypothetical protein VI299_00785 [Polyangiales bacterium]
MKTPSYVAVLALLAYGCDDPDVQAQPYVADAGDEVGPAVSGSIDAGLDASQDVALNASGDASGDARDAAALPYAQQVVSFRAGSNAGYGRDKFPGVVLGPPSGEGTNAGALDVLSLGVGGEIVLDLGSRTIVDGPGPDFIVFENPFWPGGVRASVFAELGEVSVSEDLTTWQTFPCSTTPSAPGMYPGCAGWTPTLAYDPFAIVPLDPARTGGDAFDLATLSATRARYVRVRDLSTSGQGTSAGFDLDAVGIIHVSPAP